MSLQPSADAWAVAALGEAKTYVANDSFMWASVLRSWRGALCYCGYVIVAVVGGLDYSRPSSESFLP
jgi:hypothetical protein